MAKKETSPRRWTESEYEKEFRFLSVEIVDAMAVWQTYNEINRLALEDGEILRALNKDALFWKVQRYSLETSVFLMLGRIFDSATDAHSIHNLIAATLDNIEFFSKDALSARRIAGKAKPNWLHEFVAGAWVPNKASDLRHLKKALKPHAERFRRVYRPIRHKVFAHRMMTDRQEMLELFAGTNRMEIEQIFWMQFALRCRADKSF